MEPGNWTLDQMWASFSRKDVLEGLAFVQKRQAFLTVVQGLLQARLAQLTSAPASKNQDDELMTAAEVARELKVGVARAHELIRTQVIPSVRLGVRQIRVRRRDLDHALARRPTHEGA